MSHVGYVFHHDFENVLFKNPDQKKKKDTKNAKHVFKYAKKLSFEGKLRGFLLAMYRIYKAGWSMSV